MSTFFEGMPGLLQGFWWVALIASVIFIIQTILTFTGASGADGVNADFSGDLDGVDAPFQMFSFRNLVNFMLGFGWTGVGFYQSVSNKALLVLLAFIVGLIFVLLFFFIIKQFLKLTEDNTFDIEKLVGKRGDVYLRIPEAMSGKGKIQISHNGTSHELHAMTAGEAISTGAVVEVASINNKIVIVTKIS